MLRKVVRDGKAEGAGDGPATFPAADHYLVGQPEGPAPVALHRGLTQDFACLLDDFLQALCDVAGKVAVRPDPLDHLVPPEEPVLLLFSRLDQGEDEQAHLLSGSHLPAVPDDGEIAHGGAGPFPFVFDLKDAVFAYLYIFSHGRPSFSLHTIIYFPFCPSLKK